MIPAHSAEEAMAKAKELVAESAVGTAPRAVQADAPWARPYQKPSCERPYQVTVIPDGVAVIVKERN